MEDLTPDQRFPVWLWNPYLTQPWRALYAPLVVVQLTLVLADVLLLIGAVVTGRDDLWRWGALCTTVFFGLELVRRVIGCWRARSRRAGLAE